MQPRPWMPSPRSRLSVVALYVGAVGSVACGRASIAADDPPSTTPVPSVGIARSSAPGPVDAGALPPRSAFVVVVETESPFVLTRPTGGPVLAITTTGANALWRLDATGEVTPVAPVTELGITSEIFPVVLTTLAGRWPRLHTTFVYAGGRAAAIVHPYVVDVAKGAAERATASGMLTSSSPWKDGVELAWRKDSPVPESMTRGSLVSLSGASRVPLPKAPKAAAGQAPSIAGYASGVLFLAASSWPRDDAEIDDKTVFVLDEGGAWKVHALPGAVDAVVRGRTETETLAHGRRDDGVPFLARWNGTMFEDVPLPRGVASDVAPVTTVRILDDGSVWLLAESFGRERTTREHRVFRGDFPALGFSPVALPSPELVPVAVAGSTADDVWIEATLAGAMTRGGTHVLLHTQPREPGHVTTLPTDPEDLARLIQAEREAAPMTPACRWPAILLGLDGALAADEVAAFAKSIEGSDEAGVFGRGVVVRTPAREARFAVELHGSWLETGRAPAPKAVATFQKALAAAKARFPSAKDAKLVCARWPVARAL